MVNKILPWFILIFIEPSRSLHYKFQHSPLNRDENWDVTLPHLLRGLQRGGLRSHSGVLHDRARGRTERQRPGQ